MKKIVVLLCVVSVVLGGLLLREVQIAHDQNIYIEHGCRGHYQGAGS